MSPQEICLSDTLLPLNNSVIKIRNKEYDKRSSYRCIVHTHPPAFSSLPRNRPQYLLRNWDDLSTLFGKKVSGVIQGLIEERIALYTPAKNNTSDAENDDLLDLSEPKDPLYGLWQIKDENALFHICQSKDDDWYKMLQKQALLNFDAQLFPCPIHCSREDIVLSIKEGESKNNTLWRTWRIYRIYCLAMPKTVTSTTANQQTAIIQKFQQIALEKNPTPTAIATPIPTATAKKG
ncbi:MAG TPA: hypothetical protein VN457_05415 [Chlamydiales bacterium]|nr:hypothetical protein [Chlamydiales bacterium]